MKFVPEADYPSRDLILLAPADSRVPDSFQHVEDNPERHTALLIEMQMLRGTIYLQDGAITPSQLCAKGRHRHPVDQNSWHLLAINQDGRVCGGARYRETSNRTVFSQLTVKLSSMARSAVWGKKLKAAVEAELERARKKDVSYVEFGGWALAEELRCKTEGLRIALAVYSLAQSLGGCVGISTATRRHRSSSILRRIGGRPLEADGVELPPYYDPQYGCEMEILRFDSNLPNPRYNRWIDQIRDHLRTVPVIRCNPAPVRQKIRRDVTYSLREQAASLSF
jgi:hypothetical protein